MDSDAAIVADLGACTHPVYAVVYAGKGTVFVCALCETWAEAWTDEAALVHEPGCPWLRARRRRGMTV